MIGIHKIKFNPHSYPVFNITDSTYDVCYYTYIPTCYCNDATTTGCTCEEEKQEWNWCKVQYNNTNEYH